MLCVMIGYLLPSFGFSFQGDPIDHPLSGQEGQEGPPPRPFTVEDETGLDVPPIPSEDVRGIHPEAGQLAGVVE